MISIKDVARETGFSVSTVSAVLRKKALELGIKPETNRLVLETAERLGYRKNDIAVQMQSGRSKTLLLFLPDSVLSHQAGIEFQAGRTAAQYGYICREVFFNEKATEEFRHILDKAICQCPAAFITCIDMGAKFDILFEYARKYHIPCASLDFNSPDADICVQTDDAYGISLGAEHLLELGHTRIIHATDTLKAQYARVRFQAFRDCMKKHGLEVEESLCFHDYFLEDSSALIQFVKKLSKLKNPPTAITCGSDYMAVKLLMQLPRYGLRIPEDVSIVGYGGLPIASISTPRLTTVHQSFEEIADIAIKDILKLFRNEPFKRRHLHRPVLDIAETTKKIKTGKRSDK